WPKRSPGTFLLVGNEKYRTASGVTHFCHKFETFGASLANSRLGVLRKPVVHDFSSHCFKSRSRVVRARNRKDKTFALSPEPLAPLLLVEPPVQWPAKPPCGPLF